MAFLYKDIFGCKSLSFKLTKDSITAGDAYTVKVFECSTAPPPPNRCRLITIVDFVISIILKKILYNHDCIFKLLEMFPDEDDDRKTRKERDEERARKRVLTSSLLHDLRGDKITIS